MSATIIAAPSSVRNLARIRREMPETYLHAAYQRLQQEVNLAVVASNVSKDGAAVWNDMLTFAVEEKAPQAFIRATGFRTSSILSRFQRHGVPSPAVIMRGVRCYYYSALRQNGVTVIAAATILGASSHNAIARVMREQYGMKPSEFVNRLSIEQRAMWVTESFITPFAKQWASFTLPVVSLWKAERRDGR